MKLQHLSHGAVTVMAHTNFKGRRALFPTWFLPLISWRASSKMQEITHHLKKCVCGYVLLHIYLHTQMRIAAEQRHVLQVCWKWTLHVGCVSSISRLQTIVPQWGELRCGFQSSDGWWGWFVALIATLTEEILSGCYGFRSTLNLSVDASLHQAGLCEWEEENTTSE